MKVAIFDFDGTLYPEETFKLMMHHLKAHPIHRNKYRYFMTKILPAYLAYKMKLYPEGKMKEHSMRCYVSAFKKSSEAEINLFFSQLGKNMSSQLSTTVVKRLEQHQKEGYYIMLVSGAFLPLLQSVTDHLRIDCLIGTNIPFKNNYIDRETPVLHINGHRKTDKIFTQLANQEVDWENSYAYGDSFSDLGVLELVGNPVAVKPETRLLEIAQERNWEIIQSNCSVDRKRQTN